MSGAQLVDLLIKKGSVWLRKIKPEDRRHTFTLITYDEKTKPHVYVISNYKYPGQPPSRLVLTNSSAHRYDHGVRDAL